MASLYGADFYTWAMRQADAARRRDGNELDWDNIAEELLSLGRSEARELQSRYRVLFLHLLKWSCQPTHRSKSWSNTIRIQRRGVAKHLDENPGLQSREAQDFADAYEEARVEASNETGLPLEAFPEQPPFAMEQAKDPDWLPA